MGGFCLIEPSIRGNEGAQKPTITTFSLDIPRFSLETLDFLLDQQIFFIKNLWRKIGVSNQNFGVSHGNLVYPMKRLGSPIKIWGFPTKI